jgi:two-component system, NarL family, nitrate/nitrite response regulator NarL
MAVDADVAPDQAAAHNGSGGPMRVVVVWGARFLGEILAEILEQDPMVSVVGVCTELSEAVTLSPALQADAVLLDARIPEGIAAVRRALDIAPGMRIIVSAVRETEEDIVAWAEAGVIGYIPTSVTRPDFVRLVVDIHSGEQVCSGRIANVLLRRIALTARRNVGRNTALPVPALTKRERQVAELIRSGLSDKEIARQLNISVATTKSHVHNLFGKLNLQRRSQVADCLRDSDQNRIWN